MLRPGFHDQEDLDQLIQQLRTAQDLDAALTLRIVADGCTRLPAFGKRHQRVRLDRLILCEAWIDAALSLVELELPSWRLRRLVYDTGEWLCTLSRHPHVPIEIDETAEGRHPVMPVAILISLLEAKYLLAATATARPDTVPRVRAQTVEPACCDNFM